MRQCGRVRIARTRKGDPGIRHQIRHALRLRGFLPGIAQRTRHIVEHERDIQCVGRFQPAAFHRCLPVQPVHVDRRRLLALALRLAQRRVPVIAERGHLEEHVARIVIGVGLAHPGDDFFDIGIVHEWGQFRRQLLPSQGEVFRTAQPALQPHLVIVRPHQQRNVRRNRVGIGRIGLPGQRPSIDHRAIEGRLAARFHHRFHEIIDRHGRQFFHARHACRGHQILCQRRGQTRRETGQRHRTRLGDGALEQPLGLLHAHQRRYLGCPAALAENGHVPGIAADLVRVIAHPFQRLHDVQAAKVAAIGIFRIVRQAGQIAVPQPVQPVVQRDDHDISALGKARSVITIAGSRSGDVTAAVQPDHDRAFLPVAQAARPHVQEQAVFAGPDRIFP